MKKLFLAFMLLAPVAMAYGERNEIIVSPTYVNQKKENGSKVGKYALGSGVKILTETISSFGDGSNAVIGAGVGVSYNSLKVKGNGIKSDSGNLVSIPLYLIFGTGTDNGIYSKLSFGASLAGGSVKWTDKNGGSGRIKAMPLNGYAALGIGVQKNRFSFGLNVATTPKLKREYYSPAKKYKSKFTDGTVSLEFGYQPNYKD